MSLPLAGIRVLDLTRIVSGPFCSMILGDLGAEIIKIETPGEGDPVRKQGAIKDGLSWYFAAFNRNKKSVTLNLRAPESREILEKLIAHCDVVVDNFRHGVLDAMNLSDEKLQAIHPGIVRGSITGFGTSGPYKDRPAFDFIAQAISGFMSLNGGENDPPLRTGPPISDLVAGLYAALGIVAALARKERTGQGGSASISLTGAMTSLLGFHAANFLATGEIPERTGNDHGIVAPYGIFRTKDSEIAIAPSNDAIYDRLLTALNASDLRAHPDFKTNALRMKNRKAICAEIEKRTLQDTTTHWIETLNAAGVPCGPVNNLREALIEDPQNIDQHAVVSIDHPGYGPVSMLGPPLQFDGTWRDNNAPAPRLGEHTMEILVRLGLSEAETKALRDKNVV